MAKPRLYLCSRPNPEASGDRDEKEGGVETDQGKCKEGGGGKERATHDTSPLPAEAAAGIGRSNQPERQERKRRGNRSPRRMKRKRRRTESAQGGPR